MAKGFNRGDIIHLECDPSLGREMNGPHYALVVSPRDFSRLGLHIVCPISQGEARQARDAGYLISLMGAGTRTQGCVHVHQVKSLDLTARNASFKERAPPEVIEQVLEKLEGLWV